MARRPSAEAVVPLAVLDIHEVAVGVAAIRAPNGSLHAHERVGGLPKRRHLVRRHVQIHRPFAPCERLGGTLANPQRITVRVFLLHKVDRALATH